MDNQESVEGGLLDIGVGRFPVQDSITARGIINKIKRYYNQKSKGNWRNMLCFVADDDDSGGVEGNAHVMQADALTRYVSQNYANFNFDKIYIDAFEQTSTTSGQRYPDVNKAIYNRINQGALIMNYTGHGNENGWTSELILMKEDIINWNNTIYPVIITATCDFSRFDDYISQTAGEEAFLNQDGGGIALLSTTRLVYSAPNFTLNYEFYKNAFVKDSEGSPLALGEILRRTKNSTGYDTNKLNFTLLGDPAIKLPYPTNTVQTDSINGKIISNADTIRAFQQVKVSGSIIDKSGSLYNSFNGTIYPIIYDKTKKAATLSNDGVAPFNFIQQKDILFKGKATVNNGYFNFSFILPRDIDYNYDFGKISYYAMDSSTDASGNFTKIVIGGLSPTALTDNQGPKIGLFINDTTFINGGITNEYPTLLAKISDLNGINIGGHGIGHDLVAKLDNNSNNLFLLNNYYQTSMDNFQNGDVIFQLPKMDPGIHTISVKAWDINNNSAVSEISFKVLDGNAPIIEKVKCYPNPSNLSQESIYFFFEHNKNGEPLDITINIYDMTGSQVVTLQTNIQTSGFTSGPIQWDRTVGQPLPKGIYIYRITMNTKNGMVQSNAKKLIIIE